MANAIIPPSPAEINGQEKQQDQVLPVLSKLKAAIEILLGSNLETFTKTTIHDYLWLLSDLVEELENKLLR